jgi:hypothetical protein
LWKPVSRYGGNAVIGPILPEVMREIQHQQGERLEDLVTMIELISTRRVEEQGGQIYDHLNIALKAKCPRTHPGKPPPYVRDVRQYRLRFIGISTDTTLQTDYVRRLRRNIIEAKSSQDLRLDNIDNVFDIS